MPHVARHAYHGGPDPLPKSGRPCADLKRVILCPTGFFPGQYRFARFWLTTTASPGLAMSPEVKPRP